jgi:RimJ/RimL family protein N-acetyltransferase
MTQNNLTACCPFHSEVFQIRNCGQGSLLVMRDTDGGRRIGSFRLTPLPGNHGILVFNAMKIEEGYRNMGFGTAMHSKLIEWGGAYRAAMLLCTTLSDNLPMHRILRRFGWVQVAIESVNPRTGNHFSMWRRSY